ncbi:hypothetical protein HR060_11215 [Catenovulum sp. SM1970]|uniref:Spy/CpxP family protein refolding chaperone n=1 Tax=Marinifaba aquimaris TaxID=2741323 RepID=UPI001573FA6B|nr:hypothetical protein [Marinifaba aquimaris]NTS77430.1 hypothetical protein [Marinifaba aquimaris]
MNKLTQSLFLTSLMLLSPALLANDWQLSEKVLNKLNLSEQQHSKILEIKNSYKSTFNNLRKQIKQDKDALSQLNAGSANYLQQTEQIADKIASSTSELTKQRIMLDAESKQVLSTEQRDKLNKLRNKKRNKMKKWQDKIQSFKQ